MNEIGGERLFVDFVNSEWYDGRGNREDRLLDGRWRTEFLDEWPLGDAGTPSASTLRGLMELRGILRSVVEELHRGGSPSTAPLEAVASELGAVPMRLEISGDPPTSSWIAVGASWTSVKAEIIRSCLELLAGPARQRLRRCENEGCRWAFVDASRNRSRRWCDPAVCGNVAKVRAYRARLRSR